MSEQVYSVKDGIGFYGTMMIPKQQFRELFVMYKSGQVCKINEEEKKRIDCTGMGVCVDRMLQSYNITHIRGSGWRYYCKTAQILGYCVLVDEDFEKEERIYNNIRQSRLNGASNK